ncbi:unnamed protein product [Rhizopus stolonifer]
MTHLSDMSYLQRCSIWICVSLFLTYSIYRGDRFKCLRAKSILSGELKSIITIMLILVLMLQFMWDILMTYLKYNEGYFDYQGHIISKPFILWTPTHQQKAEAFDYIQCVTFSMEAGIFLLLQSFWNYLSNTVAKKTFMSSFEFRFYIVCALASVALFPILQWVFRESSIKREAIPQLTFSIEVFIIATLGFRTHFRFKRLIALTQKINSASQKNIVVKLSYFKDMNKLTSIILYCYSIGFIILCIDGLTTDQVINQNKFALDVLIANTNVCTIYLLILLISIFHPRPQYIKRSGESSVEKEPPKKIDLSSNPVDFIHTPQSPRNMAIEDPYSNQPIMFSMVDPTENSPQPFLEKRTTSPYQGSIDEYSQTMTPTSQIHLNHENWLYQSPDRRNT